MRRFRILALAFALIGAAAPATTSAEPSNYLGCFADNQRAAPTGTLGRDLDGYVLNHGSMTVRACLNACAGRGFALAGVQYGSWCFCGNAHNRHGASAACTMPCAGNPREICGGVWANSVYRVRYPPRPRVAPQQPGTPQRQGGASNTN